MSIIVKIQWYKNKPTLFINDHPIIPYAYFLPIPLPENIKAFATAGVRLFTWGWSDIIDHSIDMGWVGPGQYDYSRLDYEVGLILNNCPDAYLIPRVAVSAPKWWLELHPEQRVVFDDGYAEGTSMASQLWLQDAIRAFAKFVEHVESMPYADHVIGYQITGGVNEWFYISHEQRRFADFSKAALDSFRLWLRGKYNNDERALRDAWNDPAVTFDTVTIPNVEERFKRAVGLFRVYQKVVDFYEFMSSINSDALLCFCKTAKEITNYKKICGAFWGYIINVYAHPEPQQLGHQALRKILNSAYIDFICAPYQYYCRGPGGSDGCQVPIDSVRLHGKLFLTECDHPTFLAKKWYDIPKLPILEKTTNAIAALRDRIVHGYIPNQRETLEIMKRDFAHNLIKGTGMWWMDLIPGQRWYAHPDIMRLISTCRQIMEESLSFENRYHAEIAIIVDEETPYYVSHEILQPLVYLQDRWHLARIGAPYDWYIHNDLADPLLPDYKLYIFLNTLFLTTQEREAIKEKVRRKGATVIWIYAPGFVSENGCSITNVCDLVGMEISYRRSNYSSKGGPLHAYVTDFEHPFTEGLTGNTFWGTDAPIDPIFYCTDPDVKVLGRILPAPEGLFQAPGFCVKEFSQWTSVYFAVPNIPSCILRNIARYAGCHIYSDDDDIVYANDRFLAIHAGRGGLKKIHLPEPKTVVEAFSGKVVAENATTFVSHFDQHQTQLYRLF